MQIIESAVSDVHYIDKVKPLIAKAIVSSYVEALTWTHGKIHAVIRLDRLLTQCSGVVGMCADWLRRHPLPATTQVVDRYRPACCTKDRDDKGPTAQETRRHCCTTRATADFPAIFCVCGVNYRAYISVMQPRGAASYPRQRPHAHICLRSTSVCPF